MAFQFNISPTKKASKSVQKEKVEEDVAVLTLAPFTANPKICFEDGKVGVATTKKLLILNPLKNDVLLELMKAPPEERKVTFNWNAEVISSGQELILEITWCPKESGSWRDIITLGDGFRIRKEIPIVFKCTTPKKPIKARNKARSITVKIKSPVDRAKKRSPLKFASPRGKPTHGKRSPLKQNTIVPKITIESPQRRGTFCVSNKENYLGLPVNSVASPATISYITEQAMNIRRQTYVCEEMFDDSLEQSPSPKLVVEALQNMQFTPNVASTFSPSFCSTGEKSKSNSLNLSGATYNISGNTYVKDISGETYIKSNLSGGTYIKGNLSGGTYIKDDSMENFFTSPKPVIALPDSAKNVIEANNWADDKRQLDNITEESSYEETPQKSHRKRKMDLTNSTPSKKPLLSTPSLKKTKFSKGLNLKEFIEKSRKHKAKECVVMHNPEAFLNGAVNPYVLATTNEIDPFMNATLYYEPRWVDEQEVRFKKLLNALLTPPEALQVNIESHPVDVAKLWQECKKKEVSKAPTKEEVSSKFVNKHLESIRKNAINLFRSHQVCEVLSKCAMMVENGKLSIRNDKNVHLDLGLQYEIMVLFLSYNPLWLRVGLETIFGVIIPLHSNSDIMGLSSFIMKYFFKDSHLLAKHKTIHSNKYATDIKKHILKKFLMLIYFLDYAKSNKLVPYDPCLYCKNAPYKESRMVILKFSSEVLSSIGDITKCLRLIGYVLTHKQTYINEFDYAVDNLGADLRDGVRLTRIMEIILLKDNLLKNVRVPAISRLQKVHNVKLAFDALTAAQYMILHEITPKDIVDGHKEKTLSFLWQIIYKFQAPRFTRAVVTVQNWWRSLGMVIKRKMQEKRRLKREAAAVAIQKWYRRQIYRCKLEGFIPLLKAHLQELKANRAAVKIQSTYRMFKARREFLHVKSTILNLQRYARKWLVLYNIQRKLRAIITLQSFIRAHLERKRFLSVKHAVLQLEVRWVARRLMQDQMQQFQQLKSSAILIQRAYRSYKETQRIQAQFQRVKIATVTLQNHFRAYLRMKHQRDAYNKLRGASIVIQARFRAQKATRAQQTAYLNLKKAAITIQRIYRANCLCKKQRSLYLELKLSAIYVQRTFRANKAMQTDRNNFNRTKCAAVLVQQQYRALVAMHSTRNQFNNLKRAATILQRQYKAILLMRRQKEEFTRLKQATIVIQQRYRALIAMLKAKTEFNELKRATITLQQHYRALLSMRKQREDFIRLKQAAVVTQQRYRALIAMRKAHSEFNSMKRAAITLQVQYRALILMRKQKMEFTRLKQATIVVQQQYRALITMRKAKLEFNNLKCAATTLQLRYRAVLAMRKQRKEFTALKSASITTQRRFRAVIAMRTAKNQFNNLKRAATTLQRQYRALLLMRRQRTEFTKLKQATIVVQRQYKALLAMRKAKTDFNELKLATITLQRQYRALLSMREQREDFIRLKQAAIVTQQRYSALIAMRKARSEFNSLKRAAITLQLQYRALIAMRKAKAEFNRLKFAATTLQRQYRALILMRTQRTEFTSLKLAAIVTQRRYRALIAMRKARLEFSNLKCAATTLQRRYRAVLEMRKQRKEFTALKSASIATQRRFRALIAMRNARNQFNNLKRAATILQRQYRALLLMRQQRTEFTRLKQATIVVQRRYRALIAMRKAKTEFYELKLATITLQRQYRALLSMRKQREDFIRLKQAAVVTQKRYRALIAMRKARYEFNSLKRAANTLQLRYRGLILMRKQKTEFTRLKQATIVVQQRYRALIAMRKAIMEFTSFKFAATTLQRQYRGLILMRKQRMEFTGLKRAAIVVQQRYRALIAMRTAKAEFRSLKRAAFTIQLRFRATLLMREHSRQYQALRQAAVIIQERFRAYKAMETEQIMYFLLKTAATTIQARFRANKSMKVQRERYTKLRIATISLQRQFRALQSMRKQRSDFCTMKQAALYVQRRFRAKLAMREARKEFNKLKLAANKIQCRFRALILAREARREFLHKKQAVIKIQKFYRGYHKMREAQEIRRLKFSTIVKLQCFMRGCLARRRAEELKDPVLVEYRKQEQRRKSSATLIQACWRGYKTRKSELPEVTKIRQRFILAEKTKVPEKTLGHRKDQALKILVSDYSTLVKIIQALEDLEYITRRSPAICLDMSEKLSEDVIKLIKSSGRSLPDMNACVTASLILINFSKHTPSRGHVWFPHHLEGLLMVMTHWCDKEGLVFPYLCTFFWLLAHNPKFLLVMQNIPNLRQQFEKIKVLCDRKQRMQAKTMLLKQSVFVYCANSSMPRLQPDWGLDYVDHPRAFVNSPHALKSLMTILRLE